jgi:hypothetical protein
VFLVKVVQAVHRAVGTEDRVDVCARKSRNSSRE